MFDNDGGGSLSIREINPLLHELGKAPKSLNERNRQPDSFPFANFCTAPEFPLMLDKSSSFIFLSL